MARLQTRLPQGLDGSSTWTSHPSGGLLLFVRFPLPLPSSNYRPITVFQCGQRSGPSRSDLTTDSNETVRLPLASMSQASFLPESNTFTYSFLHYLIGGSPPLGTRAGWMAFGVVPWTLAFASRTSPMPLLTGVSAEKLQVYHQYGSRILRKSSSWNFASSSFSELMTFSLQFSSRSFTRFLSVSPHVFEN